MQSFSLDGITVDIPDNWYGRLFVYPDASLGTVAYPTGHFATMPLPPPAQTGSFGSGAAAVMSSSDMLVVFVEYVQDDALQAGVGLFSSQGMPTALTTADFSSSTLEETRVNQVGAQRFFTVSGRAFCLFVVLGDIGFAAPHLGTLSTMLTSMSVAPRVAATAP